MEKNLTLWARITADTPAFFKRLQFFGIGLAGAATSLTQVPGIPVKLTTALIAAGTTITVVAQFAVKQCEPLTTPPNDAAK